MQSRRTTKRALATSLLSLLLCVSLLIGTTFAWFTDNVSSGNNIIAAGNLDGELEYLDDAGNWQPVQGSTEIFDKDALWEPGYTADVYLRVKNAGSLALKYSLGMNIVSETGSVNKDGDAFLLSDHIRFGVIEGVSTPYGSRKAARDAVTTSKVISAGYADSSALYPAGSGKVTEEYVALVVYMPEETGNVANHATGKTPPSIQLGIELVATQEMHESDSFGTDYDVNATYDKQAGTVSVTLPVKADADNKLASAVNLTSANGSVTAQVPAGVQLDAGATELTLSVKKLSDSNANIQLNDGEVSRSLDVHVGPVAAGNTVPIPVTIKGMLPTGLNMGNYTLYHVENGVTNQMTLSAAPAAHNEYSYDAATGDVTMLLKSFSEVTYAVDATKAWEGEYDYSWYVGKSSPYTITNADQLAGLSAIVGGMADGIEEDTFEGDTILLGANINLNDLESDNGKVFYPIGYYNSTGSYEKKAGKVNDKAVTSGVSSFEGTFDGQGHRVSNFYQNTWEMFGDYNDGYSGTPNHYKDAMGLFGYVLNGTVKNLTVDNFSCDGEFTPTGVIAAYACNANFENIAITNCNPRVYNTGNGGIVGIGGNSNDPDTFNLNFNNITVDNSNKISALWGSWDVACGGLIGMFRGAGHVNMNNCHMAAQIDVNNDVCGNYQYYWYRYAGMLIGTNKNMITDADGYTVPETEKFHAENCSVHFDSWNDYWYCELVANSLASYTHDHQFSRLTQIQSVSEIQDENGAWNRAGNFILMNGKTPTDTCYHIVKSGDTFVEHTHESAGTETVDGVEGVLREDKQRVYLPFNQLFTGYGWGVKHVPIYNDGTPNPFTGVTVIDNTDATSVEKFAVQTYASGELFELSGEAEFSLGEFFYATSEVNDESVVVTVDLAEESKNAIGANYFSYEFDRNDSDWTQSTLRFKNAYIGSDIEKLKVNITIQDYQYCKPTTITIYLDTKDNSTGWFG